MNSNSLVDCFLCLDIFGACEYFDVSGVLFMAPMPPLNIILLVFTSSFLVDDLLASVP